MRTIRHLVTAICLLVTVSIEAVADEGMWLVQDIREALYKNMVGRGLALAPGEIYNADAPEACLTDAIVSVGFHGTGSLISGSGLILTSHSCVYGDIASLCTSTDDLLSDGFWAAGKDKELRLEGESVCFLKRIIDVTSEVKQLKKELGASGRTYNAGIIRETMESRYSGVSDGLVSKFSSVWSDERCYISQYKIYDDVRLVAAPPENISHFGGFKDRMEWPGQTCDFALLRIYEDDRPVTGEKHLRISRQGYDAMDFAMVLGFPETSNRYSSETEAELMESVELPMSTLLRGPRLSIIRKWADSDPEIKRRYSEKLFSLSDLQKTELGIIEDCGRFMVRDSKSRTREEIQEWIESKDLYSSIWGGMFSDIEDNKLKASEFHKDKTLWRESLAHGTFIIGHLLSASRCDSLESAKELLMKGLSTTDQRVEKELFEYSCSEYFTNLDSYYYTRFQQKMLDRFDNDFGAMADYLWSRSVIASEKTVEAITSISEIREDPLLAFLMGPAMEARGRRDEYFQADQRRAALEKEYRRAQYWMNVDRKIDQYPDADGTLRLSYGYVAGYQPHDGLICKWFSTPEGILQKLDPSDRDFCPDRKFTALLEKGKWGKWGFTLQDQPNSMVVDFLTNADVSEGSWGSPVLDRNGALIGIVTGRNRESLAAEVSYSSGYGMCVNSDIRFILWILDKYAGQRKLIKEFDFAD